MTHPKDMEAFSNLKVEAPFVVRVDGWSFHTYTQLIGLARPFDIRLKDVMSAATVALFPIFEPTLAVTHSDEASFVFTDPSAFDRVEKIDSLFASAFASRFQEAIRLNAETPILTGFDSRVVKTTGLDDIIDYLAWRQADSKRNFAYGYTNFEVCQRRLGLSPTQAAKKLDGINEREQRKLCEENLLDLIQIPRWQEFGLAFHWEHYTKDAINLKTKEPVKAHRRRVKIEEEVPDIRTPEGKEWFKTVLGTHWNQLNA